jgi:hypothetical protein
MAADRATAGEEDKDREGMAVGEDISRVDRAEDMATGKNVPIIITTKRAREEGTDNRDINKPVVMDINSKAAEEDTMISINRAEEDRVDMVVSKAEAINKVDRVGMAVVEEEEEDINKVDKVEDTAKNVLTTITKREDMDNKAAKAANKAVTNNKAEANTTTNNTKAPVPHPHTETIPNLGVGRQQQGGGGGGGGWQGDFSGAAAVANQHAGDSGDQNMFSSAVQNLSQGQHHGPIDEQQVLQAHQQVYGGQSAGPVAAGTIGTAGALQALKSFMGSGGSGTTTQSSPKIPYTLLSSGIV